jgi:hypothetical protein
MENGTRDARARKGDHQMRNPTSRRWLSIAGSLLTLLPFGIPAAHAAAEDPDARVYDLATVCRGGTLDGQGPCSLEPEAVDCQDDTDCPFVGDTCSKGHCTQCPSGECVLKDVTTKLFKGVLTIISDEDVTSGGTDSSSECTEPDSDVGTKALTVLLEVKWNGRNVMLAETYQNAEDVSDVPRATGWEASGNCNGSLCFDNPRDSECTFEDFLLEDSKPRLRSPGQTPENRVDLSVFLLQRPEAKMAAALRDLFGRPANEVPIITVLPKVVGTTAYCDPQFSELCEPTPHIRLGSVSRFKVKLQFVKLAAP